MKMTRTTIIVSCVLALGLNVAYSATDAEVSRMLVRSGFVFDNPAVADWMLSRAELMAEHDTNRIGRLVFTMAQTNNLKIADYMIALLGTYGSASHLPYLYTQTTNATVAVTALRTIFEIEGVTASSAAQLRRFLQIDKESVESMSLCNDVASRIRSGEFELVASNALNACFLSYGDGNRTHPIAFDRMMCGFDVTYSNSLRRLRILRSVSDAELHPRQVNYVTNAINQLIAYPEASLPE